jgi:hypothetical protein
MSREHFIESHLEDKVNELIYEEDLSEEDAYIKARSIYDGEVNLMEEQAKKRYDEENQPKIHNKEILKKLRQGLYPSEIVLANVVEYLQAHYNSDSESTVVKEFCRELLTKINDDTLEVANAE